MRRTCTYTTTTRCPAAATHVVLADWQRPRWYLMDALALRQSSCGDEVTVWRVITPEFCLRHAGDVMEARNHPARKEKIVTEETTCCR